MSPVAPEDIQPVDAAPAPAAGEVAPADEAAPEGGDAMPPELAKIPAIAALANGSPPATFAPIKSENPQLKVLSENAEALKKMGFAAFESESMPGNFVLFNGLIVKPEEVMQADKAGQLDKLAVPYDQLSAAFESARKDAPAEGEEMAAPAAQAAPGQAAAPAAPVAAPAPAGAQKRLLAARVNNLQPGSPTSGPAPGRGRVLNAISKPVV